MKPLVRILDQWSLTWKWSSINIGYPFRLTGANEPIIGKHILKCQKIQNKNSACTSWHIMFVHKFSKEKNIFYVLYKKDKFMYEHITIYRTYFLSFLPMPHKMFFVVKNLCANMECPDLHAKFIFRIFWHLKLVFYAFFIIGSYTPESLNTSSNKYWYNSYLNVAIPVLLDARFKLKHVEFHLK
jgi:hypothetical protein